MNYSFVAVTKGVLIIGGSYFRKEDVMKRLFIMRKDLHMSAGKLAAQVGHCSEAYWTMAYRKAQPVYDEKLGVYLFKVALDKTIYEEYVCDSFVKVICQARNKNHLLKAREIAEEMGMIEGKHFGLIYDNCLTELEPEEENGTTLTGIWFMPLEDKEAEMISRKYHLYM